MTPEEIKAAREKKRQEDLEFVANSVNNGLSITQIRDLKPEFSYNEITPMIKELIALGKITQEQVDENSENAKKKTMNRDVKLSPDEQVEFILKKIKKGYAPKEIVESDKTKSLTIYKVLFQKRQLIAKGIITQEEADLAMQRRKQKAIERKHKKVIEKIKEYTELGYTLSEMLEFMPEYSYSYLLKIKKEYIKNNDWYTEEELKEFAAKRKIREQEEARQAFENLPPEEKKRIEEEKQAEERRLEEEKRKKQEEIMARRQKKKDETNKKHAEDINKLKQHIKDGKTMEEAAEKMSCSMSYLYSIRKESIRNNTWLTEEELKEIEKKKKQKLARKRKKREREKAERKNRRIEEEQQRIKQEIWQYREYVENGYNLDEIAGKMHYSVSHLQYLRKLAKAENIWFTEDEIKEFKRLRKIREEKEQEKAKKEEEERQRRELKEAKRLIREEEERQRAIRRERRRKIKGYQQTYKTYKKMAKQEDKLELDGEENVSTEGRKNFIKVLIDLHSVDSFIGEKDIELVLNTIEMHPELVNKDTIKFLITNANKEGGIKSSQKMVTELTDILRNTKYQRPLIEYGRWIAKQALLPQIQEMKGKNMTNADIGEKLGISSAEVNIIFFGDKKMDFAEFPDSPDDGER